MRIKIIALIFLFTYNASKLRSQVFVEGTLSVGGTVHVDTTFIVSNNGTIHLDGDILFTNDFVNNVNQGNIFTSSSSGMVSFIGTKQQEIRGSAQRNTHYINFPNLKLNKDNGSVRLAPSMSADVTNLLTLYKGKLILSSDLLPEEEQDITAHNSFNKYRTAHLRANNVTYAHDLSLQGEVEVELLLGKNSDTKNKMFGFGSPYKQLYSDYFFANYLSTPNLENLWGDNNTSDKYPTTKLQAGVGYIGGQNILPTDRYQLDPTWGDSNILHSARFIDSLVFNRHNMEGKNNPIFNINQSKPDRYLTEELNTQNVLVSLKKGWQYLSNPFTVPLDLDELYNSNSGLNKKQFYIMAGGEGVLDNWTPDRFQINTTWLVYQNEGSTLSCDDNFKGVVGPMQMFAVYSDIDQNLIIPASARIQDVRKSATSVDDILIEVKNSDKFDRLSILFRETASKGITDTYDAVKIIDSLASPGQIFTISEEGYALIVNEIPTTVKSIEMGIIPMLTSSSMKLSVHRVNSLSAINTIWIEDRIADRWVDMKTLTEYNFISNPGDQIDRFVIHLNVPLNSQTIPSKPLPDNLFKQDNRFIANVTTITETGTGPVGSKNSNEIINSYGDTICPNKDFNVKVNPSLKNVQYNVYETNKSTIVKGSELGNGNEIHINIGTTNQDNDSHFYVDAKSTDGLITLLRRRKVDIKYIKPITYPDIRVNTCSNLEHQIKLSKFIDTTNFNYIEWTKQAGSGNLVNDVIHLSSSDKGIHTFVYEITDVCENKSKAKFYLTNRYPARVIPDTVLICHKTADAIQMNQILGIDVKENELSSYIVELNSFLHRSKSPKFEGAITFSAKKAYLQSNLLPDAPSKYGIGAKKAEFTYRPLTESCYTKEEYKLVLILY